MSYNDSGPLTRKNNMSQLQNSQQITEAMLGLLHSAILTNAQQTYNRTFNQAQQNYQNLAIMMNKPCVTYDKKKKEFILYLNNPNGEGYQKLSLHQVPIVIRMYYDEIYKQIVENPLRWAVQHLQDNNDFLKEIAILIKDDKIHFNQIKFPNE